MIDQARLHIQGKRIDQRQSIALTLPLRAGPSFFFKVSVVVIAALAALAI
jgi:hypothetical protein